jgi:hypothetical protein
MKDSFPGNKACATSNLDEESTKRISKSVLKILKADLKHDSASKEYISSIFQRAGLFDK